MQIATAKKYPRAELAKIRSKMLSFATLDEETAESCFYTLKRKEKSGQEKIIQGPSVRLAEIAVSCYGNIRAGASIIDNDGRQVVSRGACFDLENNVLVSVEAQRRITDKNGRTYSEDMQITTANAANSISYRNAVFKVIPMALVKPVYEAVKEVATGGASTLAQKREKVFKRFNSLGVSSERLLEFLEKSSIESVDLDDLAVLIGVGTAIRDGETTIDDVFPGPLQQQQDQAPGKKKPSFKDKVHAAAPAAPPEEAPPAEEPQPEPAPAPEKEG